MTQPICITPRETQILKLIAHEHTISEMADLLLLSDHTIIHYRKNLLRKLQVKNTAGMIRRAFEVGILKINNPKSQKI